MNLNNRYPIRVVANKTGLSTHVIRAWEKRYGAVEPDRTDTNRRLYSDEEVERLKLLNQLTNTGYNISQIANLPIDELYSLLPEEEEDTLSATSYEPEMRTSEIPDNLFNDTESIYELCLKSIKELDEKTLESTLLRASTTLSQPVLIDKIITPLIHNSGELWREGTFRTYHEHFATASLRSFLGNLRSSLEVPDEAPSIIVTTPIRQVHELGSLISAATATALGWQVIYLGPNLPAKEIAAAAKLRSARAISLSIVYPQGDVNITHELRLLRELVGAEVHLVAGGRAAHAYADILGEINADLIEKMPDFRKYLQSIEF
jgi:DNA-binding transcriptional MerR regulator/methylmalonyl-CoA mutase cobalamin-binding subunit